MRSKAPDAQDRTNQRIRPGSATAELDRVLNGVKSKGRYRGLAKNATRAFAALCLANICLARQRLMA